MPLNLEQLSIFLMLKEHPGEMYVHPIRNEIYILVDGGMLCLTPVVDIRHMTEAEINKVVQDLLKARVEPA
jgi:hypothetical protein